MIARAWLAAGAVVLTGAAGSACHRRAHSSVVAPAAQQDSLVGIVSVTGTSFQQHLVLRVDDDAHPLAATSADSAALSRLGGTNIVVRGTQGPNAFTVATFEVRSVSGEAVADGVLLREDDRFVLQTQSGRLAIGNPPAAFGALIGARIWVAGPLDTGPNSYGVIAPAPPR